MVIPMLPTFIPSAEECKPRPREQLDSHVTPLMPELDLHHDVKKQLVLLIWPLPLEPIIILDDEVNEVLDALMSLGGEEAGQEGDILWGLR